MKISLALSIWSKSVSFLCLEGLVDLQETWLANEVEGTAQKAILFLTKITGIKRTPLALAYLYTTPPYKTPEMAKEGRMNSSAELTTFNLLGCVYIYMYYVCVCIYVYI